jgi:hypothetical protein
MYLFLYFLWLLTSFFCITVALNTARARISALEAELKASVEAWESANAAKVYAENAAKSAEKRLKKLKKPWLMPNGSRPSGNSLWRSDLTRSPSLLAVSVVSLLFLDTYLSFHLLTCVCLFCLCLYGTIEKIGESWRLRQPNSEDPLLAAVDVLESNWRLVQNIL